eukprot:GHVU01041601.1.p1 GENE.GHVU01041601.1~~GHVU01041601.1.p1  ORF type:complete len:469 (+),score=79.12 GHVU01041601.1:1476-2882(+)
MNTPTSKKGEGELQRTKIGNEGHENFVVRRHQRSISILKRKIAAAEAVRADAETRMVDEVHRRLRSKFKGSILAFKDGTKSNEERKQACQERCRLLEAEIEKSKDKQCDAEYNFAWKIRRLEEQLACFRPRPSLELQNSYLEQEMESLEEQLENLGNEEEDLKQQIQEAEAASEAVTSRMETRFNCRLEGSYAQPSLSCAAHGSTGPINPGWSAAIAGVVPSGGGGGMNPTGVPRLALHQMGSSSSISKPENVEKEESVSDSLEYSATDPPGSDTLRGQHRPYVSMVQMTDDEDYEESVKEEVAGTEGQSGRQLGENRGFVGPSSRRRVGFDQPASRRSSSSSSCSSHSYNSLCSWDVSQPSSSASLADASVAYSVSGEGGGEGCKGECKVGPPLNSDNRGNGNVSVSGALVAAAAAAASPSPSRIIECVSSVAELWKARCDDADDEKKKKNNNNSSDNHHHNRNNQN